MSGDQDFRELWGKGATVPPPGMDELLKRLQQFKRKRLAKLIALNVVLLGTAAFTGFIWYTFQPQMLTTRIGIVLAISSILLFAIGSGRMAPLLYRDDSQLNLKEQLALLIQLREKQKFQQTTLISAYFILLSAGIFLYMIEYARLMPVSFIILIYGITAAWILFNWFFFRPRTIKKQQSALHELIRSYERMAGQLRDE